MKFSVFILILGKISLQSSVCFATKYDRDMHNIPRTYRAEAVSLAEDIAKQSRTDTRGGVQLLAKTVALAAANDRDDWFHALQLGLIKFNAAPRELQSISDTLSVKGARHISTTKPQRHALISTAAQLIIRCADHYNFAASEKQFFLSHLIQKLQTIPIEEYPLLVSAMAELYSHDHFEEEDNNPNFSFLDVISALQAVPQIHRINVAQKARDLGIRSPQALNIINSCLDEWDRLDYHIADDIAPPNAFQKLQWMAIFKNTSAQHRQELLQIAQSTVNFIRNKRWTLHGDRAHSDKVAFGTLLSLVANIANQQ